MLVSSQALAGVIVQNTAGPGILVPSGFSGQSFTTPSGGPWDDITFNFLSGTTPVASGTAFLLDEQYLGTPSNLSSATPGFLGESTGITGGKYVFLTTLELQPGVQYFVYENTLILGSTLSGGNTIVGGQLYFSTSTSIDFATDAGLSLNFTVSGDVVSAVVPEPSPLTVLVAALLGFGFVRRYRKNG